MDEIFAPTVAPAPWDSPGGVIDTSYEALDRMARQPAVQRRQGPPRVLPGSASQVEPRLAADLPDELGLTAPDAAAVAGRDVWLVHPWNLGDGRHPCLPTHKSLESSWPASEAPGRGTTGAGTSSPVARRNPRSGAPAFLALWSALTGWRWLALPGRLPGAAWVMERGYRLFLRWRPMLQRLAFRLERPAPERSRHRNAGS
jgi:hypothetical protein